MMHHMMLHHMTASRTAANQTKAARESREQSEPVPQYNLRLKINLFYSLFALGVNKFQPQLTQLYMSYVMMLLCQCLDLQP